MAELILTQEIKKLEKFDADLDWFQENYEQIKKEHKGEYVAIKDQKIIDRDKDSYTLIKRLKTKYGDIGSLAIEFVSDKKFEYVL
jgi:hypothetical protein